MAGTIIPKTLVSLPIPLAALIPSISLHTRGHVLWPYTCLDPVHFTISNLQLSLRDFPFLLLPLFFFSFIIFFYLASSFRVISFDFVFLPRHQLDANPMAYDPGANSLEFVRL